MLYRCTDCTTIRSYAILYDETTASYSYDEMLTSFLRDDRMKNRCDRAPFIGGGSRFSRFSGVIECKPSAYVLGFLKAFKDDFPIEINGKNRPSRKFWPFPQKWMALKRYSYAYKFLRLGQAQVPISVIRIFDDFSQNWSKLYFCPRNRFHPFLTQKSNFR